VVTPAAAEPGTVVLRRQVHLRAHGNEVELSVLKILETKVANGRWQLECRSSLSANSSGDAPLALGIELVFNLLAPRAPDRYFLAARVHRPLEFRGEIDGQRLTLVDGWQRVQIVLDAEPEPRWWIVPIETVSQSESGFELIYQGSAILAVWKIDPSSWKDVSYLLRAEVSQIERRADARSADLHA
jgi:alpha-amylase